MSAEEVYAYIRNRGALYGTESAIEETIRGAHRRRLRRLYGLLQFGPRGERYGERAPLPSRLSIDIDPEPCNA